MSESQARPQRLDFFPKTPRGYARKEWPTKKVSTPVEDWVSEHSIRREFRGETPTEMMLRATGAGQ